ncbi:MAG: squalene/phytoene synthase family protein, partial [Chloroflexota bacterium]|nr:squalene/phytoene synthase family protein [Chloroflexota bacterium]
RALYAFCRWSDDIVDEPDNEIGYSLDGWSIHARGEEADPNSPVLLAWSDTRQRYGLSVTVIDDLLAGVRMDLTVDRYATFEELWLYCYRVASTVGLLSMQILGYEEGADTYAIKLGVALQLTNILRDVGEDARRGRIYLPLDELAQFNLTEQEILEGCLDERYHALMRFQVARAQRLYEEAWPGIFMLHPDGRLAVASAAEVYRAILPVIERNGYDNHSRRAHVPKWRKVAMVPRLWWRVHGRMKDENDKDELGRMKDE